MNFKDGDKVVVMGRMCEVVAATKGDRILVGNDGGIPGRLTWVHKKNVRKINTDKSEFESIANWVDKYIEEN